MAFLNARRTRRAETGKVFGRQWRRKCLKRGTSRHWNFENRTRGSRVTTISVGNMKNKAISIPKYTLNSNSVLRAHMCIVRTQLKLTLGEFGWFWSLGLLDDDGWGYRLISRAQIKWGPGCAMNRCLGLKLSKERLQGPFLFYGALSVRIADTELDSPESS